MPSDRSQVFGPEATCCEFNSVSVERKDDERVVSVPLRLVAERIQCLPKLNQVSEPQLERTFVRLVCRAHRIVEAGFGRHLNMCPEDP